MLAGSKAFSGYAVDNIDKAREFYKDILGLEVKDNSMGIIELHTNGNNPIIIYPKPDHTPATFTVLNFPVDDIKKTVTQLIEKGITFEQYEGDIKTDELGICWSNKGPNIAWFRDHSGNILSVLEV